MVEGFLEHGRKTGGHRKSQEKWERKENGGGMEGGEEERREGVEKWGEGGQKGVEREKGHPFSIPVYLSHE